MPPYGPSPQQSASAPADGAGTPGVHLAPGVPALARAAGWGVHILTASGVVIGLLALLAVIEGDARAAILWLGLAMLVDGVDGPLARRVRVREVLPRIDGGTLDNVVDYFTYCVVPALFLYRFELLPGPLAVAGVAYILATSLYTFANLDLKTADNYFVGFPAVWNVVAFYMFILDTPPAANLAVTFVLGLLTFAPIVCIHPLRVRLWRPTTIGATAGWALASLWLAVAYPARPTWVLALWLAASFYLGAISLWRTVKGPAP